MTATPQGPERFAPLPDDLARNPDQSEKQLLESWREQDVFGAVQAAREKGRPFTFWEGPPTANGRPGIHHVIARTIKDTVCRFQTMLGRRVDRKAGWDTQGLPVELEVEKSLGISGKPQIEKYGVAAFNEKCRESVWTYRKEWQELSERMGYWLDYEKPYVTYDKNYIESVWYILSRFHRAGLVYRGKKVLPYCGRCGTSLSSHEMGQPGVYQDVSDPNVTIRFFVLDPRSDEPESFLAWTTTPWTLPSNFALAVHPEKTYILARVNLPVKKGEEVGSAGTELVWVVKERAASVLGKDFEEVDAVLGKELVGRGYEPLYSNVSSLDPGAWKPRTDGMHRVYGAKFVTVDDGTGIVHQAPYGADDWETARDNNLPLPAAVRDDGCFVEQVGTVPAGTHFKDADALLCKELKARGVLFKKSTDPHSYPHCWRCKTALYYYPTPAWFLSTTSYKDRMIEFNSQANWVPPEIGQGRFGDWLENNIDWNISRDRYWGTPLPFWVCDDCGEEKAVGSFQELSELAGGIADDFDPHKPQVDALTFGCPECQGQMRRTSAVADCWLDSGSMPFAQHHWPHAEGSIELVSKSFPADFIAEGVDQTRGWFYTLHAIGSFLTSVGDLNLKEGPTYRSVVVNGLVVDKDGIKMSKSLGNVVNPWEAIEKHGIDSLRWFLLASGSPWLNKRYDDAGVVEARRRFFGTLINSYKFFAEYARIDEFDPQSDPAPPLAQRPEVDRWLHSRTQSLLREVPRRMAAYDLSGACRALENFVVAELSNWYIRRNRRRFWKGEQGLDKSSAYHSLFGALEAAALLLAPMAPFLSDMLWSRLRPGTGSVHAQLMPEPQIQEIDEPLEEAMQWVERLVVMGRALRERAELRIRQPLRAIHVRSSDPQALELLKSSFASEQVLDELNIKSLGSVQADDGKLVRLVAKANFRVLGKKLGPRMKVAAGAIAKLPPAEVARLRDGEVIELSLPEGDYPLKAEDVEVHVESQADFDVEADGRLCIWLDTELDDGLRAEGLAREVINRVNGLRKDRGLAVESRIALQLHASGALLERALDEHAGLIAAETLATSLERADAAQATGQFVQWPLGDDNTLSADLSEA